MAPRSSTARSSPDWMSKVKIASVPTPHRQPTRDYSRKPSEMPGLTEMVWKSYTTGETMVIGCPPDMVGEVRKQLLITKNYLNYIHRDDDPRPDIRGVGMEKTDLDVVRPEDFTDPRERTAYRAAIPPGWVGVRFRARPPLAKGARVTRERAIQRATGAAERKDATVREITTSRKSARKDKAIPPVPFSG